MSPSEKEFGELIGAVEAVRDGFADMRRENATDHANVMRRIDALDEKLGTKADNERVNNHAGRIDDLESDRDVWKGRLLVLSVLGGGGVTLAIGLLLKTMGGAG